MPQKTTKGKKSQDESCSEMGRDPFADGYPSANGTVLSADG